MTPLLLLPPVFFGINAKSATKREVGQATFSTISSMIFPRSSKAPSGREAIKTLWIPSPPVPVLLENAFAARLMLGAEKSNWKSPFPVFF